MGEFRANVSQLQVGDPSTTRHVHISTSDGAPVVAFDMDGGREEVERRIGQAGYEVISWNGETAHLRRATKSTADRVLNGFLIQFLIVLAIALVILVVWAVAGSGADPAAMPSGYVSALGAPQVQAM